MLNSCLRLDSLCSLGSKLGREGTGNRIWQGRHRPKKALATLARSAGVNIAYGSRVRRGLMGKCDFGEEGLCGPQTADSWRAAASTPPISPPSKGQLGSTSSGLCDRCVNLGV